MQFLSSEEVSHDFALAAKKVSNSSETIEIRQSEDKNSVYLISAQNYQLFQELLARSSENEPEELDSSIYNDDQPSLDFDSFFADLEV